MLLRVLGSAAGGGSPQWNCGCSVCAAVRSRAGLARTQSSVAVSADRRRWFLINASPDARTQIEAFPGLHPHEDRTTPLEAVLLTDAELDHTLGLLLLREARALRLYATPTVPKILGAGGSGILSTLERYCPVEWRAVIPGAGLALADGLSCRAFDVPTIKRARFGAGVDHGRVVGYRLTDERSGATLVYLPGVQSLTPALRVEVEGCACLLIDGTCWRDDELVRLGLADRTSREMGHLPIDGPDGSLAQLSSLCVGRTIFVHMNNTNPILLEDAPERRIVEESGMEVAMDGLEVQV
ncbi:MULTISPECIES: pyrroloquinoline quinone biosynthesis protein PqqB [Streptomyces]|uniref:Coenzyme PQQ synthesis protein B n=1 Tax=Streptomyces dengpaensis TaxID=2049881 RepID=A0ABN5I0I4_9ACTN|nr:MULTISPECIES: pyrroloquinoline quinone biosynthesis protein PqqB [Streptomyces]AVH55387.1 pyrroloquinoline quinone biosynthesis protein PqqB [Streptomyces dengpaensis]PIB07034.1 pyrroloquinoline quinone biosynthesis protein PqqB [Streptomyces sp. HG99]